MCEFPRVDDTEVVERVFFLIAASEDAPLTTITRLIETTNTYVKSRDRFSISQEDFDATSKAIRPDRIVGLMHTHPIGAPIEPSEEDIEGKPDGFVACIWHVETKIVTWY